MSGWQTFWLCLAILAAAPSFGAVAEALTEIARALRQIAHALEQRRGP